MTKPYPYQVQAVESIQKFNGRALLALEAGLGKSLTALLWAEEHLEQGPIVVVCPASIKWQWKQEARKHFGMKAEVLESMKVPYGLKGHKDFVYIINYTILGAWMEWLLSIKPSLVVIDESQSIKSTKTKRTRNIRKLCNKVPYVLALSGTPLVNRPAELWPTLNVLRPDLFPSFWSFAQAHCGLKRSRWGWDTSGANDLGTLHRNLSANLMIRKRKVDVLEDLPPKSRHIIPVTIDNPEEYKKAHQDFISWLAKISKEKARKALRAERLTQIGYLKRLAGTLKVSSVISWIENFREDSEGKLILFGIHKKVLYPIHKHFQQNSVLVDGTLPANQRHIAFSRFNEDKRCWLFVGNIQAAGTGWNGQKSCSNVAFAELAWTPGEHTQGEDRVSRIGQKLPVSCYYLVAKGTIEEKLVKLIHDKQKVLDSTLDGKFDSDGFDILSQLEEMLLGKVK